MLCHTDHTPHSVHSRLSELAGTSVAAPSSPAGSGGDIQVPSWTSRCPHPQHVEKRSLGEHRSQVQKSMSWQLVNLTAKLDSWLQMVPTD